MVAGYGQGTPVDWIENNVYSKHNFVGIVIMLLIDLLLFGPVGFVVWGIQMLWIPFWAAGVINGLAHWWGYQNGVTRDHSRNLVPWGIVIGGEELHNNHHLDPASVKLSRHWWEFDIGWMWIKLFECCSLLKINAR
jgi:stearoyl-CoA desaturase (delta-9 desaturase)